MKKKALTRMDTKGKTTSSRTASTNQKARRELRDHFAALSMLGTVSKCGLVQNASMASSVLPAAVISESEFQQRYAAIAKSAYNMADAMLKERDA
jgi:hypothetical protein